MIPGSKLILAGASVIAIALPALPAQAAKNKEAIIYGAGSSLIAPYIRQAADCYGDNLPLIFSGTPPTTQNAQPFIYSGRPPQDCSQDSMDFTQNQAVNYISTGSGTGIAGLFSHDATRYGDTDPTTSGNQFFPTTNYDLSDTALGVNEVNIYNNGGTNSTVGVTVVAPGETPTGTQYQNPREHYGAMIQFPLLVAPVAVVFDPVYKKVFNADGSKTQYAYNLAFARNGGGLRLDTNAMCDVFNGIIVNWNDSSLKALNNNVSLKDANDPDSFDVPLQIVGRSDSSGTTSIFSRYMAAACSGRTGNSYANANSRLPGATFVAGDGSTQTVPIASGGKNLAGPTYDKSQPNNAPSGEQPGLFTRAAGNDGVAKYVDFSLEPAGTAGAELVQGRIGYAGPDYALPAVLNTGTNAYNLFTADVANKAGRFIAPTAVSANAAYASILPPETDSKGKYQPNSSCGTNNETGRCRANPQDWIQASDKSVAIATPDGKQSYPIVGTTNFLGYTCYANAKPSDEITKFFDYYLTSKTINDSTQGLLASAGFSAVPQSFIKAIAATFFASGSQSDLHLYFTSVGNGSQCPNSTTGA